MSVSGQELLRHLSWMPFVGTAELVTVTGDARATVQLAALPL